jgi:transcriptional regulator with GAF, ATPase, and Fis domain
MLVYDVRDKGNFRTENPAESPSPQTLVYFSLFAMQPNRHSAYLIIRQGNRWTDVFRLEGGQTLVIGRASSNEIPVADERASRRHAEIYSEGDTWYLRDLGSRNGTLLNGSKIDAPTPLSPGNQIVVASCRMTFVLSLTDYVPTTNDPDGTNDSPASQTQSDLPPSITHRQSKAAMLEGADAIRRENAQGTRAGLEVLKLAFELAKLNSVDQACELALDSLLKATHCEAGGIIKFEFRTLESESDARNHKQDGNKEDSAKEEVGTKEDNGMKFGRSVRGNTTANRISIAVLAAHEVTGKAYHPPSDSVIQSILKDPSAILARNVLSDPNFVGGPESSGSHVLTTTSLIAAPLRLDDSLFGVLHLYSRVGRAELTPEDLEVTLAVAEVLSVSLSNLTRQHSLVSKLQSTSTRLEELEKQIGHTDWIGASAALKALGEQVRRVAPTQATVLIRGESGTGKELVARAIHDASSRSSKPFVAINCAALSPTLLESELFGHEKGAFTGATDRKIGKFELADGGTMLLDELGEMSLEIQAKFLRVLEGQTFERLGSNKPIRSSVRVLAATNRDLEQAVEDGRFRSDLYFRLRVIELKIPPLRNRPEDILPLAEHFLGRFRAFSGHGPTQFSDRAKEAMLAYQWPGNVRELKNAVERAHVLATSDIAEPEDLALSHLKLPGTRAAQEAVGGMGESVQQERVFREQTLEEIESEHIQATLRYTQGQKNRAASILGIERSTLDRKLKKYQS